MPLVRYNLAEGSSVEVAAEGTYVTYEAYAADTGALELEVTGLEEDLAAETVLKETAEADVATAITNLTYAKDMLTNYLSVSPGSLNGASVKLLTYVTAAIAALEA